MQTIQIEIQDKILQKIGLVAVKDHILKEIEFLYYKDAIEKINKSLQESGISNELELELARQKSWEQYKNEFLKDVIK
ncbi:MAG: hypothetical protein A2033_04105 [Bacteroidetes bacterium GWA2_31_9]|nr:MAG: hypothetical protein A2033_04105 [Bacteroidetes bacterium GWA2_31_9]